MYINLYACTRFILYHGTFCNIFILVCIAHIPLVCIENKFLPITYCDQLPFQPLHLIISTSPPIKLHAFFLYIFRKQANKKPKKPQNKTKKEKSKDTHSHMHKNRKS